MSTIPCSICDNSICEATTIDQHEYQLIIEGRGKSISFKAHKVCFIAFFNSKVNEVDLKDTLAIKWIEDCVSLKNDKCLICCDRN